MCVSKYYFFSWKQISFKIRVRLQKEKTADLVLLSLIIKIIETVKITRPPSTILSRTLENQILLQDRNSFYLNQFII